MMNKKIFVHDTAYYSNNIGDQIIMDSANTTINEIFSDYKYWYAPTHAKFTLESRKVYQDSNYKIICGTNLLNSNYLSYQQFKLSLSDLLYVNDSILMGVGWWKYQNPPDFMTTAIWKRVLSSNYIHSVRDNYTKINLEKMGIHNVLNTGCPTLWSLTDELVQSIGKLKSNNCIFTITDYNQDIKRDQFFIKTLSENYKKIFFWPQGSGDINYLTTLLKNMTSIKVKILSENLNTFDNYLKRDDVDYFGTRLHAGIRALNSGVRSFILGVDNRPLEMGKDFNLPVIKIENLQNLNEILEEDYKLDLQIPWGEINKWKKQFNSNESSSDQ